ncbi:MAG TPA: LuxR family transcriptional regulator [Acidimicrobiia bacterium]|nr:LuxR family transcriptional regulator [Acidimicrobiia bacterium]
MDETHARTEIPPLTWSDAGLREALPTGTVTLLLADVEGSTRLWETEPEPMTEAMARLDRVLGETVPGHGGVRPVEQGEGDSFVIAFPRASDAVACALDLQRAPLAPIRLRIGLHTGEAELRDEGNYMGPAVNRAARLRDLGHGGQTVMSGATHDLVVDRLPEGAWLTDLGRHRLRDLARPEQVVQLCHPDLPAEFSPLRSLDSFAHNLPVQLTSFIGRETEMAEVRRLLGDNRLVTLIGVGGAGKTRLALQVAAETLAEFPGGVWQVDLAPLSDPAVVPIAVARALGLSDAEQRSTTETVTRYIEDRQALIVLDNCEHLLDACAALVEALLRACPVLTILATSREPISVDGEVMWRVPSLSLTGDAVELFTDRARRARPGFVADAEAAGKVAEICQRLDGLPLAIELAAARLRALSPAEILDGLHDRFRLLAGGARTAVRRQQTLRASVDWSHDLLTEPERTLLRRLAAFAGGFDLDAAQAVGSGDGLARHHVLDQLALLVDKSLVSTGESEGATRYRLLETVRQYALEKLAESGEAAAVRTRHRDHYLMVAAGLEPVGREEIERRLDRVEADIDNLRAAFQWSLECSDAEAALRLASSLQPLWLDRHRLLEGRSWLDTALYDEAGGPVAPAVRAQALADAAVIDAWTLLASGKAPAQVDEAVALARQLDDPKLLARTLTAAGCVYGYLPAGANRYFDEAAVLARQTDDVWTLVQILGWQTLLANIVGDPVTGRATGEEGNALARKVGSPLFSRQCRVHLGAAMVHQGDLGAALELLSELNVEAEAAHATVMLMQGLAFASWARTFMGELDEARELAESCIVVARDTGVAAYEGVGHWALSLAAMAAADVAALIRSSQAFSELFGGLPEWGALTLDHLAVAEFAAGNLTAARRRADDAVAAATGFDMKGRAMEALLTAARVSVALGEVDRARDEAHRALAIGAAIDARIGIADTLECLAGIAGSDDPQVAARLFGAADSVRRPTGAVRFRLYQPGYDADVAAVRASMGDEAFERAWEEGAALLPAEAVAYAQRGRGGRKRPSSGWASLTPAERDVVRLVAEGLANKEIADRLFISHRTVQAHLTHVYTKLGVTSRVQLAQEVARHA